MTRDEIIKLASQAIDDTRSEVNLPIPFVMRFAMLVAAAEREACTKLCEKPPTFLGMNPWNQGYDSASRNIASAIRERGNQPPRVEE